MMLRTGSSNNAGFNKIPLGKAPQCVSENVSCPSENVGCVFPQEEHKVHKRTV